VGGSGYREGRESHGSVRIVSVGRGSRRVEMGMTEKEKLGIDIQMIDDDRDGLRAMLNRQRLRMDELRQEAKELSLQIRANERLEDDYRLEWVKMNAKRGKLKN
jgi:hypothetical protein